MSSPTYSPIQGTYHCEWPNHGVYKTSVRDRPCKNAAKWALEGAMYAYVSNELLPYVCDAHLPMRVPDDFNV